MNETATAVKFVCVGSVRGWCGHEHRSEDAAERCCDRDQAGCEKRRGYSDRRVYDACDEALRHNDIRGYWLPGGN